MGVQYLGDLVSDRIDRIESAHRLLEDHADPGSENGPPCLGWEAEEIQAIEGHLAAAGRFVRQEVEQRKGSRAFPATGFADQSDSLAGGDVERFSTATASPLRL